MEYWTHAVPEPMKHESQDDAIAYLSSFITQLPPKMSKLYLDCHKKDYKRYSLQMIPSRDSNEIYAELRHRNFKNEEILDSYKVVLSRSIDDNTESSEIVSTLKSLTRIADMVGIEVRGYLDKLSEDDKYDITDSKNIPLIIEMKTHGLSDDKDEILVDRIEVALGDVLVYDITHYHKNKIRVLDLLDEIVYAIESYYIKELQGGYTPENGNVGKHSLELFLKKLILEKKEVRISVVDKEDVEQAETEVDEK